jgi:hypothetical protein
MKYNSRLTKRYYFPIVEGSNYGWFTKGKEVFQAFTTYIEGIDGLVRITNYSQIWHWFGNRPVVFRRGYHFSWYKGSEAVVKDLNKANKYLDRQYIRMERCLQREDYKGFTKLYTLISKRSALFRWVIIIRKLPFMETNLLRVLNLFKDVGKLLSKDNTKVKFKRVFLPEYDSKGNLKKYRPLGVPSAEWRVIGAMEEFYLCNIHAESWATNQYACMPGRGVADAWIHILKNYVSGVKEIVGYDLAKFFDTVFITEIDRLWRIPPKHRAWLIEMSKSKAKIRPQDMGKETERIENTKKEVTKLFDEEKFLQAVRAETPVVTLEMKAAMAGWYIPQKSLDEKPRGLPQGLNTSPILACSLLQRTNYLKYHPEVVQYMDDGVIMSEAPIEIQEVELDLDYKYSGVAFAPRKTEVIMKEGLWVKPLKFLGCSFDGETFRAHTRSKGIYTVRNASQRIAEIITWLTENRGEIGGYRSKMTSLIADGWNRTDVRTTWWSLARTDRPYFEIVNQFSTWWEETKAKVTRLPWNSVEAMAYRQLKDVGPMWESSNTQTMLGSYYLLSLRGKVKETKAKCSRNRRLAETAIQWATRNRLLSDW